MSGKIFSPKQLAPAKTKLPVNNFTTIVPDKDNGNRLTIVHSNGKTECLEDSFKTQRSGKDANGIFTIVEFFDTNDIRRKKSVLSKSGTNPDPDVYDVRTMTYYDNAGVQSFEEVYTISYDVDGDWIGEVLS